MTIFYIHTGNPFYLKYSLSQTRDRFPGVRLILLGDETNSDLENYAEHHSMDRYFEAAGAFARIYRHLSPNSIEFELFCIQRWFLIEEFVRREGIKGPILHLDSDVLVYENVFDELADRQIPLATTRELGPAFTFFRDPEILAGLVRFIGLAYDKGPILETLESIYMTGDSPFFLKGKYVSDMQLLGLYSRTLSGVVDLFHYRSDLVFDYAFHSAEGYAWNPYKRIKRIWWRDGQPYGRRNGVYVRFAGLHFQVGTKIFIPLYYRGTVRFADRWKYWFVHGRGALTTAMKFLLDVGRLWRLNA